MLVICPHCNKKHTIDEKKIPANATKARCTTCGKSFVLDIKRSVEKKNLKPKNNYSLIVSTISISGDFSGVKEKEQTT